MNCARTILYKPLSPKQLAAVISSGWRRFSADTPEQKVFYPKLHLEYAEKIARQWDAAQYEAGFVVKFKVPSQFVEHYDIQSVGYDEHREYKVPITELDRFNRQIIGPIRLISAFTMRDNSIWTTSNKEKCLSFH